MVSELFGMMIRDQMSDPFWTDSATDVLTGLMLILLEKALRDECNIKSLIILWNKYLDSRKETLQTIKILFDDPLVMRRLGMLYSNSEKTVGSIETVVTTEVNKLAANDDFVEFLSQDGFEFHCVSGRKTAIYLVVPDENTFTHFAASIF